MRAGEQADSRRQQEGSHFGGGQWHALHAAGYAAPSKELSARPPCKACMTHSNALPAISILVVLSCSGRWGAAWEGILGRQCSVLLSGSGQLCIMQ